MNNLQGTFRIARTNLSFFASNGVFSHSLYLPEASMSRGIQQQGLTFNYFTLARRSCQHQPRLVSQLSFSTSSQRQAGTTGSYQEPLDTSTWKPKVNKRWTPMTVVLICVPLLTFGLGTWQVQRLKWKRRLIEDLEHKMRIDPIPLPKSINPDVVPEFEYRKVRLEGRFDHSKEILIESRTRDAELGYHLITPFIRTEGGEPILVNRGFIKREFKEQSSREASVSGNTIELIGMLRKQESKSLFQPENKKESNQWYFVDILEIANHLNSAPVLVDAITYANSGELKQMLSKGNPIGRSSQIQLRNMHVTYIVTWYGLSAITSIMAFRLLRKRLSGRSRFAGVQ
ncbi:uncharacterized protein MELLADRAFT_71102 [Melampsora larici-populina 98AG31]|uniref:SURF1-like protein n=1 Tax=Melampsora larici-populina (strain 98AG31 / pathotype 3-4-7) TaxID=747676 RepID=F4RCQ9_MELLP|nr:uncharacterized protein MELLADRAFT_71102 [Melampsora larici-populina 98AG31]EGG10007.1 hypothetical protein MELLADRAFT_71102 [Melampsora larici-populina 98AG31]